MARDSTDRVPPSELVDLIDLIYSAAVDPPRWTEFARALSERCDGAAVSIVLHVAGPGEPSYSFNHEFDVNFSGTLNRFLPDGIPWRPKPGEEDDFFFGSDYFPDEKVAETEFYREVMQPQGFAPLGPLVCPLAPPAPIPDALVVLHVREGGRPFDARDLTLCRSLSPHLKRAYRIHDQLHGERERRRAMAGVVDRLPTGVVLLDARSHCVILNKSAERILEQNDGLSIVRETPTALLPRDNELLREAMLAVANEAGTGLPGSARVVPISRPSERPPFTVMLVPLMDVPSVANEHSAVSVLFVTDPEATELETTALQQLYRFTPAEAGLVVQLLTGCSLEEASSARGIQLSTARGHLKAAFQKTGTRSQRDLMRLVLTGVGPMRQP